MAFRWLADDGSYLVVFGPLAHYLKKPPKKRCWSWTPSGKTFWIRAWTLIINAASESPLFVKVPSYGFPEYKLRAKKFMQKQLHHIPCFKRTDF